MPSDAARDRGPAAGLEEEAARLRQKKRKALKELRIPEDALPGSLALTYTRCGKANCRCAGGEGHPGWQLTFMVAGQKRVHRIPAEWAEEVQERVEAGHAFKEVLGEVLTANAELLVLARKQRRAQRTKSRRGRHP